MAKLIGIYVTWVVIFAFVNAKKNNSSIFEEIRNLLKKNILFVQGLLQKLIEKKGTQEEEECDIAAKMYTDAMKLNAYVETMINYKYVGNHGWEYETLNFMYCITHQLPVVIKIRVFNNMIVRAKVITSDMTVVDIVEIKSGKTVATAQALNFVMPDTEPSMESVAASISDSEKAVPMNLDDEIPSAEKAEDSNKKTSYSPETTNDENDAPDEAKAKIIVENYLVDNYTQLEALANEAIVNNSDNFYFTPDLEGEVWLSCIATLIVEKLQYKSATVEGNNIHIYVNMESPADDGNYDFETNEPVPDNVEKKTIEPTPDNLSEETSQVVEVNGYREVYIEEDVDDIPEELIPEEPEDIPQ